MTFPKKEHAGGAIILIFGLIITCHTFLDNILEKLLHNNGFEILGIGRK
jgi:hypothetical protein